MKIDANTVAAWSALCRGWHYHPNHIISSKPGIAGFEDVHMVDVPTVYQLPGDETWPYFVAGYGGNRRYLNGRWHARHMYLQDGREYEYHCEHYGKPSPTTTCRP